VDTGVPAVYLVLAWGNHRKGGTVHRRNSLLTCKCSGQLASSCTYTIHGSYHMHVKG
jgi:hypothetical protein